METYFTKWPLIGDLVIDIPLEADNEIQIGHDFVQCDR